MANYDITLKGTKDQAGPTENVVADAYQQEGPMTTFFQLDGNRTVIDCWSTRVASFRTADLVAVRLVDQTRLSTSPDRLRSLDYTAHTLPGPHPQIGDRPSPEEHLCPSERRTDRPANPRRTPHRTTSSS